MVFKFSASLIASGQALLADDQCLAGRPQIAGTGIHPRSRSL
jgi:hypothetical protein